MLKGALIALILLLQCIFEKIKESSSFQHESIIKMKAERKGCTYITVKYKRSKQVVKHIVNENYEEFSS